MMNPPRTQEDELRSCYSDDEAGSTSEGGRGWRGARSRFQTGLPIRSAGGDALYLIHLGPIREPISTKEGKLKSNVRRRDKSSDAQVDYYNVKVLDLLLVGSNIPIVKVKNKR